MQMNSLTPVTLIYMYSHSSTHRSIQNIKRYMTSCYVLIILYAVQNSNSKHFYCLKYH